MQVKVVKIINSDDIAWYHISNKEYYAVDYEDNNFYRVIEIKDGALQESKFFIRKCHAEVLRTTDISLEYRIIESEPLVEKYKVVYQQLLIPVTTSNREGALISLNYYTDKQDFEKQNQYKKFICIIPDSKKLMKESENNVSN